MPNIKNTFLKNMALFFNGLMMGTANKVPGVSGGTVAFVLGFYEELIYTFGKINNKALLLLVKKKYKVFFRYINFKFLLWVMGGSLFSYFSVSIILDYLILQFEIEVWSVFFGLIIGTIYYIFKYFEDWRLKNILFVLLGTVFGFAISFFPPAIENDHLLIVFLCGFISVSGMILPGLSGSFLLILTGNYYLLLVDAVHALTKIIWAVFTFDTQFLKTFKTGYYLCILAVFFIGSLFGLVLLSRLMAYVLKKHRAPIRATIMGFITGSLGTVWPWKDKVYLYAENILQNDANGNPIVIGFERYVPDFKNIYTVVQVLLIIIGFMMVLYLDTLQQKRRLNKIIR